MPKAYTLTAAPAVELAGTTYTVEIQTYDDGGQDVHLTGPRGAVYFLREFLGADTGVRQVISWKTGQPLRSKGNEIRVVHIGDVIEVVRPATN